MYTAKLALDAIPAELVKKKRWKSMPVKLEVDSGLIMAEYKFAHSADTISGTLNIHVCRPFFFLKKKKKRNIQSVHKLAETKTTENSRNKPMMKVDHRKT